MVENERKIHYGALAHAVCRLSLTAVAVFDTRPVRVGFVANNLADHEFFIDYLILTLTSPYLSPITNAI
jgi:hypothetical protein